MNQKCVVILSRYQELMDSHLESRFLRSYTINFDIWWSYLSLDLKIFSLNLALETRAFIRLS